jgi:hypothetical protein
LIILHVVVGIVNKKEKLSGPFCKYVVVGIVKKVEVMRVFCKYRKAGGSLCKNVWIKNLI